MPERPTQRETREWDGVIEREIREGVESREMRPRESTERLRVRLGELREMEPYPPVDGADETRERRWRDLRWACYGLG
jgi:hypothetical protein